MTGKRRNAHRARQVPQARPLTSLPMQRCCPTPFSHLWWRLILQALQRRPCFAVFPARNTTCLAVVPDTSQTLQKGVQRCRVKQLASLRSEHSKFHTKWPRKKKTWFGIILVCYEHWRNTFEQRAVRLAGRPRDIKTFAKIMSCSSSSSSSQQLQHVKAFQTQLSSFTSQQVTELVWKMKTRLQNTHNVCPSVH